MHYIMFLTPLTERERGRMAYPLKDLLELQCLNLEEHIKTMVAMVDQAALSHVSLVGADEGEGIPG